MLMLYNKEKCTCIFCSLFVNALRVDTDNFDYLQTRRDCKYANVYEYIWIVWKIVRVVI